MTPEAAIRTYGLLNGMLQSCQTVERVVPDIHDQERLRLRAIEASVTEALSVVLREHPRAQSAQALCCSFCAKTQAEVAKLVAGPSAYICDECIHMCNDIMAEEREAATAAPGDDGPAMAESDSDDGEKSSSYRRSVPPKPDQP